jgi:hypothetical protein
MSREETLRSILSMEAYWGSPRGGSWSDHGPGRGMLSSPFETANDLTEDTAVVYHVDEEGYIEVLSRDRNAEESLESFKARVALVLGETTVTPTLEELN